MTNELEGRGVRGRLREGVLLHQEQVIACRALLSFQRPLRPGLLVSWRRVENSKW